MAAPRRSSRSNQGVLPVRFQDEGNEPASRLSPGSLSDVDSVSESSVSTRASVVGSSISSSASSLRRASVVQAELRMARMERAFLEQKMEQERRIFRLEMEAAQVSLSSTSRSSSPVDESSGLTFKTCVTGLPKQPQAPLDSAAMAAVELQGSDVLVEQHVEEEVLVVEEHAANGADEVKSDEKKVVVESRVQSLQCAQDPSSAVLHKGDREHVRDPAETSASRSADKSTELTTGVTGSSVRDSRHAPNTVQAAFKSRSKPASSHKPVREAAAARGAYFETPTARAADPRLQAPSANQCASARRVQDWVDRVQVPVPAGINQHQVKPLELPRFDGMQRSYVRWRQRFMRLVDDDYSVSEDYKMARLREALDGGKAEELICEVLDGPGAYRAALEELEAWYGSSERELERQQTELMSLPRIVMEKDTESLQKLAVKLRNVILNMSTAGMQPGRELYIAVTQKLPRGMLSRYMDCHDDNRSNAQELSQWLMRRVNQSRHVDARLSTGGDQQPAQREQRKHRVLVSNASQAAEPTEPEPSRAAYAQPRTAASDRRTCPKCRGRHALADCSNFLTLGVQKRWDLAKLVGLCLRCLQPGHFCEGVQERRMQEVPRWPSQSAALRQAEEGQPT